mmetsp:Transcript_53420/g.129982  ORF Transcript_53420/g.129982 Transcript_53420/m.129982 type:complete len:87 (-) Transcript_53420:1791-2051(-)
MNLARGTGASKRVRARTFCVRHVFCCCLFLVLQLAFQHKPPVQEKSGSAFVGTPGGVCEDEVDSTIVDQTNERKVYASIENNLFIF